MNPDEFTAWLQREMPTTPPASDVVPCRMCGWSGSAFAIDEDDVCRLCRSAMADQ